MSNSNSVARLAFRTIRFLTRSAEALAFASAETGGSGWTVLMQAGHASDRAEHIAQECLPGGMFERTGSEASARTYFLANIEWLVDVYDLEPVIELFRKASPYELPDRADLEAFANELRGAVD